MRLIPKPNGKAEIFSEKYQLKGKTIGIDRGEFSEVCIQAFAERRSQSLNEISGECDLRLIKVENYQEEEYELVVGKGGIELRASAANGVIYGLTTVHLLMDAESSILYCRIHDFPKYQHRGLSLDCVRHFVPVSEIKKILEQMSLVKMNTLHLHLTNDQGWRVECKAYPKLHRQHGDEYFSQEELREIVSYAAVRGVEIVPEIDMPGHVSALLAAYPEYSCSKEQVQLAVCGGIYPKILCAGNEDTYQFVEKILDEMCELFPGRRFHIGGDEAPKKEWKKCGCCQKKMQEEHLKTEEELQGYFSNRVAERLEKKGKTCICWNDSLMAENISRKNQVQFWSVQYEDYFPAFIDEGGQFINSDMFTYYLDYPHSMSSLKKVYNALNVIKGVDYTEHPAMLGIEACIWMEHIREMPHLERQLFPRLYAVAEKGWTQERDYDDFVIRLEQFLRKDHPADMVYTPQTEWNPTGKERQRETFAYMRSLNEGMTEEIRKETVENAAPNAAFQKKFMECFFEAEDAPFLEALTGK